MVKLRFIQAREGGAKLIVPESSAEDPFHLPVFFNPRMRLNRSVSSLALHCSLPLLKRPAVALDGLCSIGARGIRYAKENGIKKVHFVDANPDAIRLLRRNIKLNGLKNAEVHGLELNKFLALSGEHFDFIELDPFGSPVFFLQNAIRKLSRKGVLSVTATDLANLAGANVNPTIKNYGAKPVRCEYSHEVALRILVGKIAKELMQQDFGCLPLLSFYQGHSIKAVILCEKSAEKADGAIRNLGYIMHCAKCLNRTAGRRQLERCGECGSPFDYAGELWVGNLADGDFLECAIPENGRRNYEDKAAISKLLLSLKDENSFPPGFFDLHALSRKYKFGLRKMDDYADLLRKKGFRAAKTHFSPTGLKADAPFGELVKILKKA